MVVLMLMSMLMSYASVDFFVLSFVLSCAYAYVTSEDQAYVAHFTAFLCSVFCFSFTLYVDQTYNLQLGYCYKHEIV